MPLVHDLVGQTVKMRHQCLPKPYTRRKINLIKRGFLVLYVQYINKNMCRVVLTTEDAQTENQQQSGHAHTDTI